VNAPEAIVARPQLVALDLIRTLVAFDTTSRESNLALIDWVRDYLAGHGIDAQLSFDDDRRKANLFATLPAQDGNTTQGGIVLSVIPTSCPSTASRGLRRPSRSRSLASACTAAA
jgi:hypothetical protein